MKQLGLPVPKLDTYWFAINVGTKSIRNNMINKLVDIVWRAVERVYALPDDIFDLNDDENAIIDE